MIPLPLVSLKTSRPPQRPWKVMIPWFHLRVFQRFSTKSDSIFLVFSTHQASGNPTWSQLTHSQHWFFLGDPPVLVCGMRQFSKMAWPDMSTFATLVNSNNVFFVCYPLVNCVLPSGKPTKNYETSPCFMGKLTINGHFHPFSIAVLVSTRGQYS